MGVLNAFNCLYPKTMIHRTLKTWKHFKIIVNYTKFHVKAKNPSFLNKPLFIPTCPILEKIFHPTNTAQ